MLALGNGAPDLSSCIAAVKSGHYRCAPMHGRVEEVWVGTRPPCAKQQVPYLAANKVAHAKKPRFFAIWIAAT
jgi:hypothetical protein